jgi:hypothetical protein
VKQKYTATELGDGRVSVEVECEDGEIEQFVMRGLPVGRHGQLHILEMTIQSFLADRAHKRAHADLRARIEYLKSKTERRISPPVFAELLISYLAPENSAQALLGDLQEMFENNISRLGERQARRKYWMQVAVSFRPLVWQFVKRTAFVSFLIHYFRSKMGF